MGEGAIAGAIGNDTHLGGEGASRWIKQPSFKMKLSTKCPLVSVGERTSLDGKVTQVTFVREKPYTDLALYLEYLTKLATAVRDMLDGKRGLDFWVHG